MQEMREDKTAIKPTQQYTIIILLICLAIVLSWQGCMIKNVHYDVLRILEKCNKPTNVNFYNYERFIESENFESEQEKN